MASGVKIAWPKRPCCGCLDGAHAAGCCCACHKRCRCEACVGRVWESFGLPPLSEAERARLVGQMASDVNLSVDPAGLPWPRSPLAALMGVEVVGPGRVRLDQRHVVRNDDGTFDVTFSFTVLPEGDPLADAPHVVG